MRHVAVMTATGALGLMAVFLVDAANLFYISLLGAEELAAAIGFAGTAQFFTISVSIGFAIAAAALVSRRIGAKDRAGARRIAASALVMTLVVMSAVSALAWLFRLEIVTALGAQGETAALASRFLAIVLPSLPLMGVGMTTSSFLRASGDARRAMTVTLAGGAVAAALDPLFIFGLGMGLDGAAAATVITRIAMAALGVSFAVRVHDIIAPLNLRRAAQDAGAILKIAAPTVATQLSTPTGMAFLTRIVAENGDDAVAGWAVVGRVSAIAFGGLYALSGAVGPIIGQNLGAQRIDRVKRVFRDALLFNVIYVVAVALVMLALRGAILDVFGLVGDGRELAGAFLLWGSWFFAFSGALFVANAAFNNLGRPLYSTALNWSRDAALTPALALVAPASLGAAGAVFIQAGAGMAVGLVAAALAGALIGPLACKALKRDGAAPHPSPPMVSGRASLAVEAALAPDDEPR